MPLDAPRLTIAEENRATVQRALVLFEQAVAHALGQPDVTAIAIRLPRHGPKFGKPVVVIESH